MITSFCTELRIMVAVVATLSTTVALAEDPSSERPVWVLGDSWSYLRTDFPHVEYSTTERTKWTYSVSVVRQDYYILAQTKQVPDGLPVASTSRWSPSLNRLSRSSDGMEWQEFQIYKWPLVEGAKWTWRFPTATYPNADWGVTVRGWETVDVPAGRFRALRLDLAYNDLSFKVAFGITRSIWYAPDVKRHVRLEEFGYGGAYMFLHSLEELTWYQVR